MGSFDGAELCELVGLFLLHELKSLTEDIAIGLYRDHSLAFIRNASGLIVDRIKKTISKVFQRQNLKITVEAKPIQADFLDITFNLRFETYWPYRKPNNQPLYINIKSNHPPPIKKQIPQMVSGRLSQNSWNQEVFDKATSIYQEVLKKSGFTEKSSHTNNNRKLYRNCKVTWFNPPLNNAVSTYIGKEFFKLLDKHFPTHHKLHKICLRNTIKMSYCCMPNVQSIISRHNKNLLRPTDKSSSNEDTCNCRVKNSCPLQGNCLASAVVYKASLDTKNGQKVYFGSCATTFKTQYNNHKQTFKDVHKRNATELSKAI